MIETERHASTSSDNTPIDHFVVHHQMGRRICNQPTTSSRPLISKETVIEEQLFCWKQWTERIHNFSPSGCWCSWTVYCTQSLFPHAQHSRHAFLCGLWVLFEFSKCSPKCESIFKWQLESFSMHDSRNVLNCCWFCLSLATFWTNYKKTTQCIISADGQQRPINYYYYYDHDIKVPISLTVSLCLPVGIYVFYRPLQCVIAGIRFNDHELVSLRNLLVICRRWIRANWIEARRGMAFNYLGWNRSIGKTIQCAVKSNMKDQSLWKLIRGNEIPKSFSANCKSFLSEVMCDH